MSGLIKQQILKRLSKFTKNLSADKISLSAMKGEGDLTNLELDEVVLMELLGAPSWMKLTRAVCNRLTIKVQWTKLSSQPIILILDEVNIDMETCGSRDQCPENIFYPYSPGKYGYTEQIMDGMSLSINVININFRSSSFHATFQMSRVTVESRTPVWQVGSLDRTRIKNDIRGEIIIFKEIQWQAVRIEANALTNWILTTPLRLIANQSKIRITLKKRMSDCCIICTKVEVNMDDVLWVLTDSQVFAAMTFVDDLRNIILNNQNTQVPTPPKQSQSNALATKSPSAPHKTLTQRQLDLERFFDKFNESSYHFFSGRIELHLCDDMTRENSSYRCRVEGGAMQLVINQLEFSYYPLRHAGSSRKGWPRYNDLNSTVERWTNSLLTNYLKNPDIIAWHLERFSKEVKQQIMESCIVLRLKDLCLYCVSSSNDCKKSKPQRFFGSDKKRLLLPDDMPVFHAEFTDYYNCPVPSSLHVTVNPVCLSIHHRSLLWINAFFLNVMKKYENLPERKSPVKQIDAKVEVLMPRITLPASEVQENGKDEELLQLHSSKLLITNLLANDSSRRNSTRILASQFQTYKSSKFCNSGFRCRNPSDEVEDEGGNDRERSIPPLKLPRGFIDTITKSTTSLKKQGEDEMWSVICDQFWIDILSPNKHSSHLPGRKFKTQNFLEAFPFTMWSLVSPIKETSKADHSRFKQEVVCLISIDVKVKVIVDCQQLNFLTRTAALASKTSEEMTSDACRIGLSVPTVDTATKLLLFLPSVELCFVLPLTLMTSSSSTSIPYISSSSSSSLSLSNRVVAEHPNGPKHHDEEQVKGRGTSKTMSKDDLLMTMNGDEFKPRCRSTINPRLDHFIDVSSFESVKRQTKDTMTTMLSGLSTKFKLSDSHIHDHLDDEDWVSMMLHDRPEVPAFEKTKEIYNDNDFDDVVSDSSSNKKKVISVLDVSLRSLEVLLQMNSSNMEVMMMIHSASTEEIEKINYEKFKTTYLSTNNESIPLYSSTSDGIDESDFLKLHYEVARLPEVDSKDDVHLEVQNGKLNLKMSTLLKIFKVFEGHDSVSADGPTPEMLMDVFMKNISLDILGDNSDHKVSIESLKISKGEDGIIRIGIPGKEIETEHSIQEDKEHLQDENALEHENKTLKRQLEKLGKLAMCDRYDELKQCRERCLRLESDMKDMDLQVKHLSDERDSLLKLVDTLQSALESSENMRNKQH